MPTKLLMRWDIHQETESEYFEFLVHEFIPTLNRLGMGDIEIWYTAYGAHEQKMAEGIAQSLEQMQKILGSEEWANLHEKLTKFVDNFEQKVIPATRGFQI
ncbi:MAG: hypothetical protein AAF614_02565 [Chloroflexota bacterium]